MNGKQRLSNNMGEPKKLIEVAMPIKEISAESVRDKSIRNGHISTLHLWWARRPLPTCRAVIFASIIPDPSDPNCPIIFKKAVDSLLGLENNPGDPYKPYKDIPYTSIIDKMEDSSRNRLLMFIGKYSTKFSENQKLNKKTATKDLISDYSLIRSENKDNNKIIEIARQLIWISHNCDQYKSLEEGLVDYKRHRDNITKAEKELYSMVDRHLLTEPVRDKRDKLNLAIESFLTKMPMVFDPFAGGGAIPLEAARLGCRSYGNDLNPVAHFVQIASTEFPQKFGKPIKFSKSAFDELYNSEVLKHTKSFEKNLFEQEQYNFKNRLLFDVEYFSKELITRTSEKCNHLFPTKDNHQPIVYYWVRVGECENPTCKAKVPLLRQFYLSRRRSAAKSEYVHFAPQIDGNTVKLNIGKGEIDLEPFVQRANLKCPCCDSVTEVKKLKKQFREGKTTELLAAVIEDRKEGKHFRLPTQEEITSAKCEDEEINKPVELMPQNDSQNLKIPFWGFKSFGDMFSRRQLVVLNKLIETYHQIRNELSFEREYNKAILTYLAVLIDRLTMRYTTFNTWHIQQDTVEKIMSKQAIPMVFDYPETNPFTNYTSALNSQLKQILNYIESESNNNISAVCNNASSGDIRQFNENEIDVVVTDPPYYDAIAYADLSDFFYVWLKRTIGTELNLVFATPSTPKSEECTAIKHNHDGDKNKAKEHFENKLLKIFDTIRLQTKDIVSIMFAHQSTEAWTTLCNSILGSKMNITASWAIDTEVTSGLKQGKAYLASSVTVSCRPSEPSGIGDYKTIEKKIGEQIDLEVQSLYRLGLRGADLLTACFGKAVSEFGEFENVEKSDGSIVQVKELLEIAREAAFNSIVSDIDTDDYTKFYMGWLNLFGFSEVSHDQVRSITQIGLNIETSDLLHNNIIAKKGSLESLCTFKERFQANNRIGENVSDFEINKAHRMIFLYSSGDRNKLLKYILRVAPKVESNLWRIVTSLSEVLPNGSEDQKHCIGLIVNKDSLIRDAINISNNTGEQVNLDFE